MKTLIAIFILSACMYFGYNLYQKVLNIMEVKKINEKMVQDHFWRSQQSFEE